MLERTAPGRGGEIQLTDAIQELAGRDARRGGPVHAVLFRGRRYDTGDRASYLRAVVQLACGRADLGPDFRSWLRQYAETLPAETLPAGEPSTGERPAAAQPIAVPAEAAAVRAEAAAR